MEFNASAMYQLWTMISYIIAGLLCGGLIWQIIEDGF